MRYVTTGKPWTLDRWLLRLTVLALGFASGAAGAQTAEETRAAIAPEATEILRRMSDYLSELGHFSFAGDITIDAPLESGQSLQIGGRIAVNVQRPDRFRVSRRGDLGQQDFYYDGKRVTIYTEDDNVFAQLDAPSTSEAALDFLTEKTGVVAPGADLVYANAYAGLMEDVRAGLSIGMSELDDVQVHHLAFRGREVDWQIWIDSGEKPLPRKYVITSKWMAGSPQFTIRLTHWDVAAAFDDALFQFEAPAEAVQTDFLPPGQLESQSN